MMPEPEHLVRFRPQLRVFLRRTLIVALVTILILLPLAPIFADWRLILLGPVLTLAYILTFDVQKWQQSKDDDWVLGKDALFYSGPEGETMIPLPEIDAARTWFGWTVILDIHDGMHIQMSYLENPSDVAQQIMCQRDSLLEAMP